MAETTLLRQPIVVASELSRIEATEISGTIILLTIYMPFWTAWTMVQNDNDKVPRKDWRTEIVDPALFVNWCIEYSPNIHRVYIHWYARSQNFLEKFHDQMKQLQSSPIAYHRKEKILCTTNYLYNHAHMFFCASKLHKYLLKYHIRDHIRW